VHSQRPTANETAHAGAADVGEPIRLDRRWLRQRQDGYLTNNYIAVHNTIVSVTMAIGGVAATGLISPPEAYRPYHFLLVLLWLGSLLATIVTYTDVVIGAVALPPQVPSTLDLSVPLFIGLAEFFMFGDLAHQATGIDRPDYILEAWYFSFAAFAIFGAGGIWRARLIFTAGPYEKDLQPVVRRYVKRLLVNLVSACTASVLGLIGARFLRCRPRRCPSSPKLSSTRFDH
jgi:hypothetical protein